MFEDQSPPCTVPIVVCLYLLDRTSISLTLVLQRTSSVIPSVLWVNLIEDGSLVLFCFDNAGQTLARVF